MITIRFADRQTEIRALAFTIGRFSARVMRNGEHMMPEEALAALTEQQIAFTAVGKATYEQQLAAIRSAATPSI